MWLISRMDVAPGPTPPEVTRLAASDLSEALATNPELDIQQFLQRSTEGRVPLVVVMKDGRVVSSDGTLPPQQVVQDIRRAVERQSPVVRKTGASVPGRGPRATGPERGSAQRIIAPWRIGPAGAIFVNGELAGVVIALPRSAFRQLGPTLALIGTLLVAVGTTAAALLIFGPVRRRLRSLEDAARQVGGGDLTARAREDGGDEVAALARAFNQMTADLHSRAEQLRGRRSHAGACCSPTCHTS